MTAEAIVMNRSAVALAADSAVTISGAEGFKTFEGANKLFELVKGSNIGLMIYSNAEINGTPWETVIKTFRRDHGDFQAPYVEDYYEKFSIFVSEHPRLLSPEDEWQPVIRISTWLAQLAYSYLEQYPEQLTRANGSVIKTKVRAAIVDFCDEWEAILSEKDDLSPEIAVSNEDFRNSFNTGIVEFFENSFKEFSLQKAQVNRLARLVPLVFSKENQTPLDSGLVFAGFGTEDYFPKMVASRISARLCGKLVTHSAQFAEVSVLEPGHLQTFAQDDPARGWIHGISANVRAEIQTHWLRWIKRKLPQKLSREIAAIPGLDRTHARAISGLVLALAREQLSEFLQDMQEFEEENFTQPMIDSISQLPKDELGLLAESLVNITSLKQRMSIFDANTVGGAIDVALISIGDGFVWLNRKHYFNPELNPTWNLTHGARIAVSKNIAEEKE